MRNWPVLSIGFRPFFLLSSLFSCIAILLWVDSYQYHFLPIITEYPLLHTEFHIHEMIFGYSMAVVAGFLLTAIKNWTKIDTISGYKLAILAITWIAGRIAPYLLNDYSIIIMIDMLFLPLLTIFVAKPLINSKNSRNYFIILIVLSLAVLNGLFHAGLFTGGRSFSYLASNSAFYIIIGLIVLMAGRVFPMFSQNGVANSYQVKKYNFIEKYALVSYIVFAISILTPRSDLFIIIASITAAIIHMIRLIGWYNNQIWKVPLVWVLHVGYLFLIIGFVMTAISVYKPQFAILTLHVFSIGVLGVITVGMMARVSLGHTGRDLRSPPKILILVFLLMIISAITRVFLPIFMPTFYSAITVSGLLWALAFLIFTISYAKILLSPRVDAYRIE